MKKKLLVFLLFLSVAGYSQTITPVLYPLYMQGHGTSTSSDEKRVPYVCRMTVSGLLPATEYYFYNRWAADPGVPVEQGGIIFVEQTGNFRRSTAPSLASAVNRGTLITDANGSYTGWFASESNIATDFTPGAQLFFRLVLDLPDGTNPIRVTATQSVTVLAWDDYFLPPPDGPAAVGTGVRSANANTAWMPKNFIMLYDNEGGTGRPIAGTYVESDGVANTAANGYIAWYGTNINGTTAAPFNNRWGSIIPDDLPNGIRRIAQHGLSNGSLVNFCSDPDGDWGGSNGNTVNPTGGGANDATAVRIIDCMPRGGGPVCNVTLSSTQTNVKCFGGSTGAIDLTVTGATGTITYLWSPGVATTQDRISIAAGTYTVNITDGTGCTATKTTTITQPSAALSATATSTAVTITGGTNGTASVAATGGTSPYSYLWNPGGKTTATATGLTAGAYTVTVTDANGCTTIASATVGTPSCNITLSSTQTNVKCFGGSTGAIDLTVTGATGTITYLWSPGGATTQDRISIAAGTYTVNITDGAGCTATRRITITQPTSPLSATATSTPVTTTGGTNGTASVAATGGTSPYSYLWNPGGKTTATATGLTAGAYTVTITDANGCTATASATVGTPSCNITLSSTQTNVKCFGGSTGAIDLTVTGATGTITYLWSPGGATTQDRSGLAADAYMVNITDGAGCTATRTITITQPTSPISATATSTAVTTTGGTNGTATVTATGGTSPYSYLWNPGGKTTATATGLTAGGYTVTITDANGCTATTSATVGSPSCNITLSSTQTNVKCFGGSTGAIDLTVTGATGTITYLWSPGGATTQDRTGLLAGSYTVTVKDASNCTATRTATIIQPASRITTATTVSNVTCDKWNGSVNLTATGGTPPYSYLWSNGASTEDINNLAPGLYTVTVTDANGCTAATTASLNSSSKPVITIANTVNILCYGQRTGSINVTVTGGATPYSFRWNNGATTKDISNLAAGNYSLNVTDANGCTAANDTNITQPPSPISATMRVTNILCFGQNNGSVRLTVNGGTPPFIYLWSNGATTKDLANLTAGNYTVTVTDANGCTASKSGIITQPAQLKASESHSNSLCFDSGSAVTISATGGKAPYTGTGVFLQTPGTKIYTVTDANGCKETVSATVSNPSKLIAVSSAQVIKCRNGTTSVTVQATGGTPPYTGTGIYTRGAGTWDFTVTDANGCSTMTTITVTENSSFIASSAAGNINCYGDSTTVTVTARGGVEPYKGTGTFKRGSGSWTYTVSDAIGCSVETTIIVSQPDSLAITAAPGIIKCKGDTTTLMVSAIGGTAPYSGTGAFTKTAGPYNYMVTDAKGCSSSITGAIVEPEILTASAMAPPINECGGQTTVAVSASGGVSPYTYPGVGTYIRGAGTWNFTVTDAGGCTAETSITIPHPECLKVYPNPVGNTLVISHTKAKPSATIKVFSINGSQLIYRTVQDDAVQTTIDVSKLSSGVYLLVYYNDNNSEKRTIKFEKISK